MIIFLQRDPSLHHWQNDLIKIAARKLDKAKMIRFDERTGRYILHSFTSTSFLTAHQMISVKAENEIIDSYTIPE